jgi:CheY-like chemotaxis protein
MKSPDGRRPLVVVLDDDQDILTLMKDALEEFLEYAVHTCCRVANAQQVILEARPALVVLDLTFGGVQDGWEILEQLRGDTRTAATPVILCSGAAEAFEQHEARIEQSRVSTLVKPFDLNDLLDLVQSLVEGEGRRSV